MTGVHGFGGVAAALYHRERTGSGQHVEVSLLGCYVTCHEVNVQAVSVSDGAMNPRRSGALHPFVGGYGVFPVGVDHVILAATNDRQWAGMCAAMGRPDLVVDERFATIPARVEHRDDVNAVISEWLATQPDRDEALAALHAEHVPAAPVLSVKEAVEHPHLRQTGIVRTVTDDVLGELDIPGVPIRFSAFPDLLELRAGELGADNEAVLTGIGGMSAARYDELVRAGVVVSG
jgi:crotonobetainyl-CoA:carnitine CoA-transferase CaiB-like acyl-CoA transferase